MAMTQQEKLEYQLKRGDQFLDPLPQKPLDIESVYTIRHFELPARFTYNYQPDIHEFYEIIYVENGIFLETSEESPVVMRPGDAVIFGRNYPHKQNCDGEHSASIFITSFASNSEIMRQCFPDNTRTFIRISSEQRSILSAAFEAGVNAYDINAHYCKSKETAPYINRQIFINYIEILFLQIINSLRFEEKTDTIFFAHDGEGDDIVPKIISFLQSRIYSEISIEELCQHVGYSRGHVCNHFKKATGKTVNNYFQLLKIEEAKRLILETNTDFSGIAEMLGYSNPQYFSKVFRQYTGYTPGNFRKTIFKGSVHKTIL